MKLCACPFTAAAAAAAFLWHTVMKHNEREIEERILFRSVHYHHRLLFFPPIHRSYASQR